MVAFLVSVAMLLAMTGVAVFAQTGAAPADPAFVPATAVGYGELRLDLPGDQHDQLAAFMAHLPGLRRSRELRHQAQPGCSTRR